MTGVVRTLEVNVEQMARGLDAGYTQATDLSEFIVQSCSVDYRSAYEVVGRTVREASNRGIAGRHITGTMLDEAAIAETGQPWGLAAMDLAATLDPRLIIESRKGTGGAAPTAVESMIGQCEQKADELAAAVRQRRHLLEQAEQQLLAHAELTAGEVEDTDD
jgi:argininosuccinate lyase